MSRESTPEQTAHFISKIFDKIVGLGLSSGSNSFEISHMSEESSLSQINYIQPSTYRLDSNYNYYTDYYEDITKNTAQIEESGLPNLYIFGDDLNKQNPKYNNIITVQNLIQIKAGPNNNSYEYFDDYALEYQKKINERNGAEENLFRDIARIQKKIYYTKEGLLRFGDINKNQTLMPYSNKISFQAKPAGIFSSILQETDFTDSFCTSMIDYSTSGFSKLRLNFILEQPIKNGNKIDVRTEKDSKSVDGIKFSTIAEFLELIRNLIQTNNSVLKIGNIFKPRQEVRDSNYVTNLTDNAANRLAIANNQSNSLSRAIRLELLRSRISRFIRNGNLSPEQFLNGASFYTEIFMYEVNKIAQDGTIVQTFYMPNLTDITNFNLFDSQVKFGKTYRYSVNSFNFCLGQRLNIDFLKSLSVQEWQEIATSIQSRYPNLKDLQRLLVKDFEKDMINFVTYILEAIKERGQEPFTYYPIIFKREMFNDLMAVFDNPPPPPEIQIDGLIGIDDKIMIRLNSSISEFKATPVLIQPEDAEIFSRNVLIQKLDSLEDPMMFDGDDRPTHFQIFKLENHPKNYSEFRDNFITASTTYVEDNGSVNFESQVILKTYQSSLLDTIKANQKYYYMFRTVDVHGNVSNPSPIYEVEMINEDGTIFPLIKIVDLLKIEDKQPSKPVKRFLHIVPSAIQSLVDEQASGYYLENGEIKDNAELVKDNVVLGLTEQKVWNKNYRLKIKSKVTGKVVEIDFKFTHRPLLNPVISE